MDANLKHKNAEGPSDALRRQTQNHLGILVNVLTVVVVNEPMAQCLPKHSPSEHREPEADCNPHWPRRGGRG